MVNSEEKYSMDFFVSRKRVTGDEINDVCSNLNKSLHTSSNYSNIISETLLSDNFIHLKMRSLLKNKSLSPLKIFYSEIVNLGLNKYYDPEAYASIDIVYSKNKYSKRFICLRSNDISSIMNFYSELENRYLNSRNVLKGSNVNKDTLEFLEIMSKKDSKGESKKISRQIKFDRCSSGEY